MILFLFKGRPRQQCRRGDLKYRGGPFLLPIDCGEFLAWTGSSLRRWQADKRGGQSNISISYFC